MSSGRGLQVLLVEDDEAFAGFLVDALARDDEPVAVRRVGDLAGARASLAAARADVVLLDLNLPDSQGLSTLTDMLAEAPHVPIIVLTGMDDRRVARDALKLGAQDWLLKGTLDPDLIRRAIRYAVERKALTDRLLQAQALEIAGRLANRAAHEFNNVLTAVVGGVQQIEESDDSENRRSAIEVLRRAAAQGRAISQELLALSRHQPADPTPVSASALIAEGTALLRTVLPSTIALEIGPIADVVIEVDPGQFEQVLLNLALNARDAMPAGGTLRISVEMADGPASSDSMYVAIRMTDSGVGIESSLLPRLFVPFFTTKGASGTGLGLAISEEIVARFGGRIDVQSEPGVGSTFAVYLPAVT
jgi:two-component system, cell cycle sensor histidine kinase and response regulator CckA